MEKVESGHWTLCCLHVKAAEGSRTPRRFAHLMDRAYCRQVLECGCPLPLWYRVAVSEGASRTQL
jgi:hypothetical protein